ncbi:MAG TPA: hypothetical protein VN179_03020, partial [Solirubrobacterales bacterium]|nr:hypothetical protein [Solirubrobacterales bacterium]
MAELPRLPPAAEHRFLRFVCGLPPGVQRRLFGPPPQIDGQRLAGDIHALVRIVSLARGTHLSEGADLAEARAQRRQEAEIVAHRPPIPMARVEEVEIPGPGGA